MSKNKTDIKADLKAIEPPIDRGESTGLMEPMLVGESSPRRTILTDLAIELAARSAGFRSSLPHGVIYALAQLVRAMNCYYSNLIEGHNTHPIEIERALKNNYSADAKKRELQIEAKAHIAVQQWIDEGGLNSQETTAEGLREIHRRFCEHLPETLLWVENPDTGVRMRVLPGSLRETDVKVGRHVAISPGAIGRFLSRFQEAYSLTGKTDTILSSAAAHHRILWIHPFLDGNGRVARLMSYAILQRTLETGGIWSIARGLARNVDVYKKHLAECDQMRRNDLDGRGTLSEEALAAFVQFFLETCIDQVKFMEGLVQPARLRDRILIWAEEEIRADALPPGSGAILEAVLFRGELPRADVAILLGVGDRQARRVTSALIKREALTSASSRSPLHINFSAKLASRWMPGLFPELREQ